MVSVNSNEIKVIKGCKIHHVGKVVIHKMEIHHYNGHKKIEKERNVMEVDLEEADIFKV